MRRIGTVVGAGVLLLALTACAQNGVGAGSGAGGPTLPTEPAPTSDSVPPGIAPGEVPPDGTPVPPEKIDATALASDYPRTAWTQGDGKTLGVVGQEAGCSKVSASVLGEDAAAVKIELLETLPLEKKMCTMDIRFPPLNVSLAAPLGERKVVLSSRQEQK